MSYSFILQYGLKVYALFDRPQELLRKWFAMRDESISQSKVQARLRELQHYMELTERKLTDGSIQLTKWSYAPEQACDSAALLKELTVLLHGSTRSKRKRERTIHLTAYLLRCVKAANGREFFRSYHDIVADNAALLSDLRDESQRKCISRLLGLVVDNYLTDCTTGKTSNYLPIFTCVERGDSFAEGIKPTRRATRYRLNDEYAYLLDL